MKKLITHSNMWFFSAILFLIVSAISDNRAIWIIFAGWMVCEGISSKNKERKQSNNSNS